MQTPPPCGLTRRARPASTLLSIGLLLGACALLAPAALAAPTLTFDSTPLGGGLVGWEVGIAFDDGQALSTFVDVIFEGEFNQIEFDGLDVDTDELASDFHGLLGYDATLDSYFITSVWPDVISLSGGEVMSAVYYFEGGSGQNSQIVDSIELAYLVLPDGAPLFFDAVVSRGGVNYDIVPEPGAAPLAIAAIATLFALQRRRTRADAQSARTDAPRAKAAPLLLSLLAVVSLTACDEVSTTSPGADVPAALEANASTATSAPAPVVYIAPSTSSTATPTSLSTSSGEAVSGGEPVIVNGAGPPVSAADAALPGDANADGVVDERDYAVWRDNLGANVPPGTLGDENLDGKVDGADYTVWADNVGMGDACAGDPGSDMDSDGLSDCFERNVSRTLPDIADTDGDGDSDGEEWSKFDPENTLYRFNPRIADLPRVSIDLVQLPVVEIDYSSTSTSSTTIGTNFGTGTSDSISMSSGGNISQQVSFAHSVNAQVMVGVEVGVKDAKYKAELRVGFEATSTESQGSSVNWNDGETQTRNQTFNQSESATQQQGFTYEGGRLSGVVEIRNSGPVAYEISDLFLTAELVDPLRPMEVEYIGLMTIDGGQPLVAQVQSGQAVGPFSYKIPDLTLARAQQLLRDRRVIDIGVSSYILRDEDGISTLLREDDVAALTATIIIDYGLGNGQTDQYRVAIRQPTGEKYIPASEALRDILGLDVTQGVSSWVYPGAAGVTMHGLKRIGAYKMSASTNRYWQVAHNHNNASGTLARTTDTVNLVLNDYDLDQMALRAGDKLVLSYVSDTDRDGIPDRAEVNFGTDPNESDSDGDGLADGEEIYGWLTNLGSPPCDQGDNLIEVFSNPLSNDSDNDGTFDDVEKAACKNPSADFVADAGDDQEVDIYEIVFLTGSFTGQASETPQYTWQIIDGPPVLNQSLEFTTTLTGQTPQFQAPPDVETLTFELTVSIGDLQQTDRLQINVFEDTGTMVFVGEPVPGSVQLLGTPGNPYDSLEDAHRDFPASDIYVMTREDVYSLESRLLMDSGVSVYGGYDSDWVRHVEDNKSGVLVNFYGDFQSAFYYDTLNSDTTISGLAISGVNLTDDAANSVVAIMVDPDSAQFGRFRAFHNEIEVPDVTFRSPNIVASSLAGSSYGMYFRNIRDLDLVDNVIYAGRGGFGGRGSTGANGTKGSGEYAGGGGGAGNSNNAFPGNGSAGAAGKNNKSGSCSNGGAKGTLSNLDGGVGNTGCSGNVGGHGVGIGLNLPAGTDYRNFTFTTGSDLRSRYVPLVGTPGANGQDGSGGGGGGGGFADSFSSGGKGGNGGRGGSKGLKGGGGSSGGASIGIWIHQVENVRIESNQIIADGGGDGGINGYAGSGGSGGNYGNGGSPGGLNGQPGSRGGTGGVGGRGGYGGAGSGGTSAAIFVDEVLGSVSIEDCSLQSGWGGYGGWSGINASTTGRGGNSFTVFLNDDTNGVPSMQDNRFTVGDVGLPNSSFDDALPGESGSVNW